MALVFAIYNIILLTIISITYSNFGILVVGLLGLIILCFTVNKDKSTYAQLGVIVTIAFIVMMFQYVGLIQKFGIPYYGGDDENFQMWGHYLVQQNVYRFSDIPYMQGMYWAKGYCLILAYIERLMLFFGNSYHTVAPRILNIYLWLAAVMMVYKIVANRLTGRWKKVMLYAVGLFPNAIYISSFVYRDSLVCFLMVLFYFCLIKLFNPAVFSSDGKIAGKRNIIVGLFGIVLSVFLVFYVRTQLLYPMLLIAVFVITVSKIERKNVRIAVVILAAVIGLVLLLLLGGMDLFLDMSEDYAIKRADQNGLSSIVFSQSLLPFGLILRFIYGFMVPFPGEIFNLDFFNFPLYSVEQFFICMGTVLQILVAPYVIRRIKKFDIEALTFAIVYFSIVCVTFTFRHFILMYPFLAILVLPEISNTPTKEQHRLFVKTSVVILFGCVAYLLFKLIA